MVNGTPYVVSRPTDFQKHLVQMPLLVSSLTHPHCPAFAYQISEVGAKPIDPMSDGFVADINSPFMEKVFHVPK